MVNFRPILVAGMLTALPMVPGAAAYAATAPAYAGLPDPATPPSAGAASSFTVSDGIQVPGKTLAAGTYTIRVVDHLSDRMIVRVERKGKAQSTFLALPKSSLAKSGQGPITLDTGGKTAMRGFVFPDGTVAEFVYPKGEAVGIAKANNTTIPAIDPASEGRSATGNLSKDDMEMVTLWMLTPTPVGPDASGPGVSAAKYQAPAPAAQDQVASASVPPRPKARPKPVIAALPHTASEMPLVMVAGLGALCGAALLRRRRTA